MVRWLSGHYRIFWARSQTVKVKSRMNRKELVAALLKTVESDINREGLWIRRAAWTKRGIIYSAATTKTGGCFDRV